MGDTHFTALNIFLCILALQIVMTFPTSNPIHIDWDLGVALHYECRRKRVRKASYFSQWVDLRAVYKVFGSIMTLQTSLSGVGV